MKILLALDDNGRAVDQAVGLAAAKGAGLTALFVLDTGWSVYTGHDFLLGSHARGDFLDYARDDELAQARAAVEVVQAQAREAGVACEVKTVAAGRVAGAIVEELAQGGYALLVMGQPFRRGLEVVRDAVGEVLKQAACDVLLVRRD